MKPKGYALATVLILMGVMLFGVGAIITVSTLESKISRSHQEGARAYYVAEAGIVDALWRLNNTANYKAALKAGTFNSTFNYTATNTPATNQRFSVSFASTAANYATVTVLGYSNNGSFEAQRKISTDVFVGPAPGPTEGNAIMSGGTLDIDNGSASVVISGGDVYATGKQSTGVGINIDKATVNIGSKDFNSPRSYVVNGGTVTNGTIHASNFPVAADEITIPGIDFSYYSSHCGSYCYTSSSFQNRIANASSSVSFPGPITYVSGDVNLGNSWAKNKTINITGMLVINGSLTTSGSTKGLVINVTQPSGGGGSGVFLRSNMNNGGGTWNVNGVLYASGTMTFTKTEAVSIQGALIAGDTVTLNTGLQFNLTYQSGRVTPVFGAGEPAPVEVKHWEEEY